MVPPPAPYGAPPPHPGQYPPAGQYPAPGPYGQPGQYPGVQPARRGGFGKVLLIIVGVVVGLFALLLVLGSLVPDAPIVDGPIITDRVDSDTREPLNERMVAVPSGTDRIYAAVEVSLRAGQTVGARWYYGGRHQPHLDTNLEVPDQYQGWAAFDISNGGSAWPPGTYRVEIYVDGAKEAEAAFGVN